jgi:ParE toxin of type II toxin-antitoxin system, parDE
MGGAAGHPMPVLNKSAGRWLTEVSGPLRVTYRRLRVGSYRVLYEVEGDLITIVRIDRV